MPFLKDENQYNISAEKNLLYLFSIYGKYAVKYHEFYSLGKSNENQIFVITFLIFMLKTFLIHQIVSLDIRKKIQQK